MKYISIWANRIFLVFSFFGALFYSFAFFGKSFTIWGGLVWMSLSIALLTACLTQSKGYTSFMLPILLLQLPILFCWIRYQEIQVSFLQTDHSMVISYTLATPLHIAFLLLGILCIAARKYST